MIQKKINRMKKCLAMIVATVLLTTGMAPQQVSAQTINVVKPIVIVLDAGHGGADSGATHKWNGKTYKEKDANLAIAKACKAKLETYSGVKVLMTRTSDRFVSLTGRVSYAKKNGADLFVALHNNAALKSSVKGACVYYPNSHYNAKIGAKGKSVAQNIQNRLVALGLKNNGVKIRTSSMTRYSDRSLADYYSVIRNSKREGFAGLIVEHAYITNSADCTKYLGSSDMLTKLGEADAMGIASYYGLIAKTSVSLTSASVTEDGGINLQWSEAAGVDGYCIYRQDENESSYQLIKKIKGAKITTYTDNTNLRGVTYTYTVCGYHTGTNATTYTTSGNQKDALYELPVPENVSAQRTESGGWKLVWTQTDTSSVSGYCIARKAAGDTDYEEIATVSGAGKTSYELSEKEWSDGDSYVVSTYYEDADYYEEGSYSAETTLK